MVKLGFQTSKPFNEVRFKYSQALNLTVGGIRIYYAFAEPGNCDDCVRLLGEETSG